MSILQMGRGQNDELLLMRSWMDNVLTDASEQLAPTRFDLTNIYARSNIAYRASNKRGDAVSTVPFEILDSAKAPLPT